ncbi:chemotaxis protein CheR [Flavihumibacter sp. R14]|nr:chemotaxis protein CheR [Flavihumibacter soli]
MSKPKDTNLTYSSIQFPVVGIGASAGGLEAIKVLLASIPADSGMAYVFVQHLSSEHESALPEILKRIARIPVVEVTDEIDVRKDHFYTIPSNKTLVAVDGKLKLTAKKQNVKTIDVFFSSLGVVHQSYAVGIVLSGSLNDGTMGLQIIKTYGGITLAQDENSAAFESMPSSAVKAGVVDFVLPPGEMISKLIQLNQPFPQDYTPAEITDNIPQKDEKVYQQLLTLIKLRKGVDFAYYRSSTLKRRIARRMALSKVEQPEKYLDFVRENKMEQDALFNDILISVTNFFRDPKSFEILCNTIFPRLLEQKGETKSLRIWVAGCATGEEAYSIAMCLLEYLEEKALEVKIRIFATDISEAALAKARAGTYQQSDLLGVSPARLQRFFNKLDGSYQVDKSIRDLCVFAQHNLLKDPPFSQLDVISCRNVLIYLEPFLQKTALSTFHYSLTEKGFLMLGKAESIGSTPDLFKPFDSHEKIYYRIGPRGRLMQVASSFSEQSMTDTDQNRQARGEKNVYKVADDILLQGYAPSGVLINDNYDIIQFRGHLDQWLTPSPGKASLNILKMTREGLAFELRNLLAQSKKNSEPVRKEAIYYKAGKTQHYANLEVIPIPDSNGLHYLVLFQNSLLPEINLSERSEITSSESYNDPRDLQIQQLETELLQVREDMRAITEMQETANEELLSTNQELLSSSEELQSLNEELETSQEELQSTNEELVITNRELLERNNQLNISQKYTEAIVNTVRDALLILNTDLFILRATEGFYNKFKMVEQETEGKYLFEVGNSQWNIPELRKLFEEVRINRNSFKNFEVSQRFPHIGLKVMCLNGQLIRSISGEDLILLSIEDVTYKRKVEAGLAEVEMLLEEYTERLRFATKAGELGTWDFNISTREFISDKRFKELLEINPGESIDVNTLGRLITPDDKAAIKRIFENSLKGESRGIYDLEIFLENPETKISRWLRLKGKTYFNEYNIPTQISGILMDITPQKNAELSMKNVIRKKDEFISTASHELKSPITSIKAYIQMAERELSRNKDNQTAVPLIKKANAGITKLTHLLNDLLDATQIQSGKLILNKAKFNIRELIEDVLDQLKTVYSTHSINLEGESDVELYADKARLEQVIINLLSNAIKYSPDSEEVILNISHPNRCLRIEVIDFGIGIQKDELPHIFDRFFRVQKTSNDFTGLGLGLYISSEIIDRHHGEMGIESEPGKGSKVWFTLPLNS